MWQGFPSSLAERILAIFSEQGIFFSIAAFATPMKAFNCLGREKQEGAEYGVAL